MLQASGVPTAVGFRGAAEAAEAKSAVAPIMERIVFIPNFLVVSVEHGSSRRGGDSFRSEQPSRPHWFSGPFFSGSVACTALHRRRRCRTPWGFCDNHHLRPLSFLSAHPIRPTTVIISRPGAHFAAVFEQRLPDVLEHGVRPVEAHGVCLLNLNHSKAT